MEEYHDVENRKKDYDEIQRESFRAELGIRTIGLVYHDHSLDEKSFENVFILKDNIEYRLFSAAHQYLLFLRELGESEKYLQHILHENQNVIMSSDNVYFNKVETELSSIFDSIVFHLSSVFDYLSHAICYMYFQNKQDTLYWTKLSKKVRGDFKDKYEMSKVIDDVDRRFVGKLYDYRSRLLHNKRDKHIFDGYVKTNFKVDLKICCSNICLKHFSAITNEIENKKITLTFLSSQLIRQSFIEIEKILDSIKLDLEKDSKFNNNLIHGKGNRGMFVAINPETNTAEPSSNRLWKEYKSKGIS